MTVNAMNGVCFASHFLLKDVFTIYEEQRLISLGWPLEDAVTLCNSLRKEGVLQAFVEAEEEKARETFYKSFHFQTAIKGVHE